VPLILPNRAPIAGPYFWEVFGHSYQMTTIGTLNQTGRVDSQFRTALGLDFNAFRNHAVSGGQLVLQGRSQGGFARLLQEVIKSNRTGPYAQAGGAYLLGWGINDLGFQGNSAQIQNAFTAALTMAISRCRASSVREDTDGSISYGAGFAAAGGTGDFSSGSSIRNATTTTAATATITLPADYRGEPIGILFNGASGVFGGTVTFSGTAGVTGTLSTSNVMPGGSHGVAFRRITNLTAANAGQTIIMTVTALDTSGSVSFDAWWIEAHNPNPVIVNNVARLPVAGYNGYPTMTTDTQSTGDAKVATFNGLINTVVAGFDSMVQVADIDSALAANTSLPAGITTLFASDNVHPNEFGAALAADAIIAAIQRLTPTAGMGRVSQISGPAPQAAPPRIPRIASTSGLVQSSVFWYTPDFGAIAAAGITLSAAGTMWAMPVYVSEATERWIQLQLEVTTASAGTTSQNTIRWGLYDDVGPFGYPQNLLAEPTSGGALSLGATTGMKQSAASGAGSLNQPVEPGMAWLVVKSEALPVGTPTNAVVRAAVGPNMHIPAWSGAAGQTVPNAGLTITGQAAGALPTTFPLGATPTTAVPLLGFRCY